MKVLFLLKKTADYGGTVQPSKTGLRNSAAFVTSAINQFSGVEALMEICIDGNSIDRLLHKHKPELCVIEAIWVHPDKLRQLVSLHPHVRFVVRVHSKTPFLAMEGNAIAWLKEYNKIALVSFNHRETAREFEITGIQNIYLPNIYPNVTCSLPDKCFQRKTFYKIGCFGAIRPFKNQLAQAMAAIQFAEKHHAAVHFYINYSRVEQRGESVLKNIRALFEGTKHKLIEVEWLDHCDFIQVIRQMDACMQVSFTETFNIVTADCIASCVPVVVSDEISWLTGLKADPASESDMMRVLEQVIKNPLQQIEDNIHDLNNYNQTAILRWFRFLNRY